MAATRLRIFVFLCSPGPLNKCCGLKKNEAAALGQAVGQVVDAYDLKTTKHVLRKLSSKHIKNERKKLKAAPEETDGSTLNALLLNLTQQKGWAANLGDSRSAWFIDDVVNQTKDHTPNQRPDAKCARQARRKTLSCLLQQSILGCVWNGGR